MTSPIAERTLTAEEFRTLPADPDGRRRELFDGRVIVMPQPGEQHSDIAAAIYDVLTPFVRANGLGKVRFDVGFLIRERPDRVVAPDVAWVRDTDLPGDRDVTRFIPGPPALAVEVISPHDINRDTESKVVEYLRAGAARVWLVRPDVRAVTVYADDGSVRVLRGLDDRLTSEDAGLPVPGFVMSLAEIFGPTS